MDYQFEFSFHKTREEWDEEQREHERWSREFEKRARGEFDHYPVDADEDPF